jgi:hypothetical protein
MAVIERMTCPLPSARGFLVGVPFAVVGVGAGKP